MKPTTSKMNYEKKLKCFDVKKGNAHKQTKKQFNLKITCH